MKVRFTFLSLLVIISFYGCSNSVMIKPNYDTYVFKENIIRDSSNYKVTKVIDNRKTEPTLAGTAQVGMFNKTVPYYLNEPVRQFVENAVNKIIYNKKATKEFASISIAIDSFKVYEKTNLFSENGYFDCKLRFYFTTADDSLYSIITSSHQVSNRLDATGSLEGLIYQGLVDCVQKFYKTYKDISPNNIVKREKSSEINIAGVKTIEVPDTSENETNNFTIFGAQYLKGDKIKNGFQFTYQFYSPFKNPQFEDGFGYSFSYYDILNNDDLLKGSFFSFNGRYSFRYYTASSQNGIYFSGGLRLTFGNEKIDYGYSNTKSNFFFGPNIEEIVGISISKKVFLEAGLFQILYAGSKLLPSDFGYLFGFYFKL